MAKVNRNMIAKKNSIVQAPNSKAEKFHSCFKHVSSVKATKKSKFYGEF